MPLTVNLTSVLNKKRMMRFLLLGGVVLTAGLVLSCIETGSKSNVKALEASNLSTISTSSTDAQIRRGPKVAPASGAAKEGAVFTIPKNFTTTWVAAPSRIKITLVTGRAEFLATSAKSEIICKYADSLWTLGKGFSWQDCMDKIFLLCPKWEENYDCYSLVQSFFKEANP